jgi:CubicO group peptidase (beta-lactamase class C family)
MKIQEEMTMVLRKHWLASVFLATTLTLGSAPWANAKDRPSDLALLQPVAADKVGFDAEKLKALDAAMADAVSDGQVAGMTTLLVRHGKVVEFNTYGQASIAKNQPMTKDTLMRIYSMTKPITGVAMMMLFEEGKWTLDDPVSKFIPEFDHLTVMTGLNDKGEMITVPAKRSPTMRELMSHTAGLGYGLDDKHPVDKMFRDRKILASPGLRAAITEIAKIPLKFQPGEGWAYSAAVDVQGYLVEQMSGQTLGNFMQSRIFGPLKMTDTSFIVPKDKVDRLSAVYVRYPVDSPLRESNTIMGTPIQDFSKAPTMESGGGGLVSSTSDYGRFSQMILNGGQLDGKRLLKPETVALMGVNVIPHEVLVTSNGSTASRFNEAVGFGLDFMVVNDPVKAESPVGKGTLSWGGAAGTWFWIDPTNDLYFVGMIQRLGGTGKLDLRQISQSLTYKALVDPRK